MAGRGRAEAEQIGVAKPPTARADTLAHQRHSRGAEDATGGTEAVRRGRDAPTPTGCTRSRPERPQAQQMPQGWTEAPTVTGYTLTASTGAQERHTLPEVGRGYPLTLSRSQPRQTRHRPRQAAQGAEHPPIAHRAHRWRAEATQSEERGEGHSYPPTAPREPQPPRMTRRGCATHLYEYGSTAQPQSRKPARRKG